MRYSNEELVLLGHVVGLSGWHIDEDNIVAAGALIRRGLIKAMSDYDCMRLFATEAGIKAALRLKLVVADKDATFSKYSITPECRALEP